MESLHCRCGLRSNITKEGGSFGGGASSAGVAERGGGGDRGGADLGGRGCRGRGEGGAPLSELLELLLLEDLCL